MPAKRVKAKNLRFAALIEEALRREQMSIEDLGRATGFKRNAGALARGEVVRPSPDQLNALAKHLPVTVDQMLKAYGFDIAARPSREVDPELARLWPRLSPGVKHSIVVLAQASVPPDPKEDTQPPPSPRTTEPGA